jgi:hypothetical protein
MLVDPYSITYTIFDNTGGVPILMPPANKIPRRVSVGAYFADYTIPQDATFGKYLIQWRLQETSTSPETTVEQEFGVVGLNILTTMEGYSDTVKECISKLRTFLRDNNPDRNYHFRPPTDRNIIRGYTEKFGFIWENSELVQHLECAAEYIGSYPPRQIFSVEDIPPGFKYLVVLKAAEFAITALSLNWIEEEFGYSIQGISLDIDKSSKYMAMGEALAARTEQALEKVKSGFHFTRGLQQQKFRMGAQGVLGPYTGRGSVNPRNWVGSSLGTQ